MDLRNAAIELGLDVHPKRGDSESWVIVYSSEGNRWAARSDNPTCELYVAAEAAKRFHEWTVTEMDGGGWEVVGLSEELEKHSGVGDTWAQALIAAALSVSPDDQ